MTKIQTIAREALTGGLTGRQYMFGMLVGYAVFLLFSFAHFAIGGEITRTSAGHALRLGWGIFGLVAGSALVIAGLGFGLGVWRLWSSFAVLRKRIVRSLIVLHGLVVVYASGLALIWLTILTIRL